MRVLAVLVVVACSKSTEPPTPPPTPAPADAPPPKLGPCGYERASTKLAEWQIAKVSFEVSVGPIGVDGTHVYWHETDPGPPSVVRIRRVLRTGGDPATIFEVDSAKFAPNMPPPPDYIALAKDEVVYSSRGAIHALPVAGGTPRKILDDWFVHELRVDRETVYFVFEKPAKQSMYGIAKVPLAGGKPEILVPLQSDDARPRDFVVTAAALYWISSGGDIHRFPHGGTDTVIGKTKIPRIDMVIAADDKHVYVGDQLGNLLRVPVEGGAIELVASGQVLSPITAIADAGDRIAVGVHGVPHDRIRTIDKATKAVVDVACVETDTEAIVRAGADLFHVQRADPERGKPGTVVRTAIGR